MKIVDANIILRYLLNDHDDLSAKAATIIENNKVLLPNEVVVEVVYVLEKVYRVKNDEICDTLLELFKYDNIDVDDIEILEEALILFGKRRLDFVDTLLYAYNKVKGYQVYTFDKKLNLNMQVMILSTRTINDERSIQCLRDFKKCLYSRACKPCFNSSNRGFWNSNTVCKFLLRHIQLLPSCFDLCSYSSF
jgi:predicted nucleic-acid-binding protein